MTAEPESERWLPVPVYEDLYEVSDLGRVKSFHRAVPHIMRPAPSGKGGYLTLGLSRDGSTVTRTVHSLVAEAFIGPRPDGMEVRHKDGQPTNCRLDNLSYGTSGDNNLDQVEHGTHNNASKDVCKNGHDYTEENTYYYRRADGSIKQRACKICRQDWREQWDPSASGKTCTEEGCGEIVLAKDLCQRHYHQKRREAKRQAA